MINNGRIVASGTPASIIKDVLPDSPEADLNDVFIKVMARNK